MSEVASIPMAFEGFEFGGAEFAVLAQPRQEEVTEQEAPVVEAGFECEVSAFEQTLPTVNGLLLNTLPAQFEQPEEEGEDEDSEELTPQQKIAQGKAMQSEGYAALSSGIFLSESELTGAFTAFLDSLDTVYPMKPVDAIAEVHPESAYLLVRRRNLKQQKLLRAELQKHLQHPVIKLILDCPDLGKEMLDGAAEQGIGGTMNSVNRLYKVAKSLKQKDDELAALRAQLEAYRLAGAAATVPAPVEAVKNRKLTPAIIEAISTASGTVREVAQRFGVSSSVVGKYRKQAA